MVAVSYGLDHQIPIRNNRNNIATEFEYFYQNLLNDMSHIPKVQLRQVKTKLRDACEKYCRMKIPYKHRNDPTKHRTMTLRRRQNGRFKEC